MTYPTEDLLEAHQLAGQLGRSDLVLIDTRDESDYRKGHIPGAVCIQDIFYYLCLPENGGLPAMRAHFTDLFGRAGIHPGDRVVVYEDAQDNGYGKSCRGWLLLKYLGHSEASVLHGGFRAWRMAGLPVSNESTPVQAVEFQPVVTPGHIISQEEVLLALEKKDIQLLDCRDYAEWLGANSSPYGYDYCPRKGRIPGAHWLEWYRLMARRDGVTLLRTADEIRAICADLKFDPQKRVIVYCFKGARASVVVMALRQAGFSDVVNYFPSWNEWSRDFSLPVDEEYPED